MTPDRVAVPKERAQVFLAKAERFLRGAQTSLAEGLPDAAAVMAIHAGISACDSLTVYHLGFRSNTRNHLDVIGLLKGLKFEGREPLQRQMRELIAEKHEVAYEDRLLMTGDAAKLVRLAERVVATAQRAQGRR